MQPIPPPHQPGPSPDHPQQSPFGPGFPHGPVPPELGLTVDQDWLRRTRQRNMALWGLVAVTVIGCAVMWGYDESGVIGAFLIASFLAFSAFAILVVRVLIRLGDKPASIQPVVINYGPGSVLPGWYPDPQGVTRWHDGKHWTPHTHPPQP